MTQSKKIPKSNLNKLTLEKLCNQLLDKEHTKYLIDNHPYNGEITQLNCLQALKMFNEDLNEKTNKFYVLAGGLSQIPNNLEKNIKKNGGVIKLQHRLTNVKYNKKTKVFTCLFDPQEKYKTKNLILALDGLSLINLVNGGNLEPLKSIKKSINSIIPNKLLRTYCRYPNDWFKNFGKVVTGEPIKFIIPINPATGLIMSN